LDIETNKRKAMSVLTSTLFVFGMTTIFGQPFAGKGAYTTPADGSVKIIFDTDMHTDCDDAGALAILHTLADKGECEIGEWPARLLGY
jgi:hypothetical protein